MVINIYTNANNLKKFYLGKLVQQKCGNFEVDDSNGFTKIIWPEKQVTIMIFPILPKYYKIAVPTYFYVDEYELNSDDVKIYLESKDCISLPSAYSARTAHPFQRNGAPFRFKLSKAQQVD